jgi:hypothetical protein
MDGKKHFAKFQNHQILAADFRMILTKAATFNWKVVAFVFVFSPQKFPHTAVFYRYLGLIQTRPNDFRLKIHTIPL